jgi:predicted MFS family arabinose efflux permease
VPSVIARVSGPLTRLLRFLLMAPAPGRPDGDAREDTLARNLHLTVVHGIFNSASLNMAGPFVAIFAMKIGASQLHVAFLTSAPAIVSLLAMIPGALTIDRSDRKKELTWRFMLGHRVFYLALACVPFFPAASQPTAFVVLLALTNLPGAISNVAWQAFVSRLVPPDRRAETFAARNRVMSLVGTAITLGVGLFLDHSLFPLGYQLAFVGAFALAVAELAVFARLGDGEPAVDGLPTPKSAASPALGGPFPPLASAPRIPVRSFWDHTVHHAGSMLREKRFVRYTLVSMFFYFAWQIPWPLFSWYQVRVLHANNVWVSMLALMNTGGALAGYGFWTRMIKRWGNMRALWVSTFPVFVTSLIYASSRELYTVAISNLIVGAIFAGVNIALFNTLLDVVPEQDKTSYIAWFNTAVTVSSVFAPLAGVSLLRFMDYREAFLVTALVRLIGSLAYWLLYRVEKREGLAGTSG